MIPLHASMELELLERLSCLAFGHVWAVVAKEPAIGPFSMCLRCGRWTR